MNKMKAKIPLFFLFILLFLPSVIASTSDDGLSKDYPFVDVTGRGVQGGTGYWNIQTPLLKPYNIDIQEHSYIMFADIDRTDSEPEILLQEQDILKLMDTDSNDNLIVIDTIDVGDMDYAATGEETYPTPSWVAWNSTHSRIVTMNGSHVMDYWFNGTDFVFIEANAWQHTQGGGTSYPVVVCSDGLWVDNDYRCFIKYYFKTSGTVRTRYLSYNLNETHLNQTADVHTINGDNIQWRVGVPRIADADNDGYLEMYAMDTSGLSNTPPDLWVDECEIDVNGSIACTNISYQLNIGATHDDYTDIIISNIDGAQSNGLEISYMWSDATNWFGYSFSTTGSVLEDEYYGTVINDVEGDFAARNLVAVPETEAVCGVIHDETASESTAACFRLVSGVQALQDSYTDTSEISSVHSIIGAHLTNDTHYDLAYANVILDSSTTTLLPLINFTQAQRIIPVDNSGDGSLDLIAWNGSSLWYYDDGVENQDVVIDEVCWSSGNPVCNNTLVRYTVNVTDSEDDLHNCTMEISYANGTSLYNSTNSQHSAPHLWTFTYRYLSLDAFTVEIDCIDVYSDSETTYIYNTMTASSPACYNFNQAGNCDNVENSVQAALNAEFDDNVHSAFADIGIDSAKGRGMFWILLMIAAAFLVIAIVSKTGVGIGIPMAIVETCMLVLGWLLGMISSVVLIMVGLMVALVFVLVLFGKGDAV